ncbi:insulinase family protein [Rhodococcus sp. NPDC078407]|uniref:insulinase family protein n=1 Tax=Rhodococcus sp. NPDC078407 TaxID=3364509 RepID=UPI0037CAE74E
MTTATRTRQTGLLEQFGTTTLLHFSWVLPAADLMPTERTAIAYASGCALATVTTCAAAAQVRTTDTSVVMSVRTSAAGLSWVARILRDWRHETAENLARRARPGSPSGLVELADRLTVIAPGDNSSDTDSPDATDFGRSTQVLLGRDVLVHMAGGYGPDDLASFRDRVTIALGPVLGTAVPVCSSMVVPRTAGRLRLPKSAWVALPGSGSPLVRLYTRTCVDSDDQRVALSMANVLFGGVFDSALVRAVRRRSGLSYSCGSQLRSLHSVGMLVVDIRTGPGMELACVGAAAAAVDRFRESGVSAEDVDAVRQYLIGRAVVESDILPARTQNAAVGENPHSVVDRLATVDTRDVAEQIERHFRSDHFNRLVVSTASCPRGWKEIGRS